MEVSSHRSSSSTGFHCGARPAKTSARTSSPSPPTRSTSSARRPPSTTDQQRWTSASYHNKNKRRRRSLTLRTKFFLLVGSSNIVSAVQYRGWVNPLRYASYTEEGELVLSIFNNLEDAEQPDFLMESVKHHSSLDHIPMKTLERNRQKFLVGTSDCNKTLNATSFLEHADMLAEHGFKMTRSFLNIGAKDGLVEDPCVDYAKKYSASGIHFEKDPEFCRIAEKNFQKNLPGIKQTVICAEVTPMNIVDLLEKHVPSINRGVRHFDLIKIDIDSYDAMVLDTLLRNHFSAKHWILEVNPAIPPPYQFATLYHPKLWQTMLSSSMGDWPLRGMSLSYAVNIMAKWGYELVLFEYHDAIFVHKRFKQIYGFTTPFDEFDCYHKSFVMSNGVPIRSTRKWFYEVSPEQGAAEIFQHMIKHALPASNGKFAFPFTLSY
ncbi:unnamed protein product [Amoebophrya sp. A25]|nr:unnamed protein product [Amoebophrya sp. A25]|eukprot:GSA25T00012854001.1